MIINMSGGGGSTELFSAIAVTYPEGSICTATNGTEDLTAPNTNGSVIFAIPEPETLPETWTVTSTDPTDATKTKSQSVSISKEGQFESVELAYRTYLFNDGSIVEWTGYKGQSTSAKAEIGTTLYTKRVNNGGNCWAFVITSDAHDISKYSKLCAEVTKATEVDANILGLRDPAGPNLPNGSNIINLPAYSALKVGIVELDISELTAGSYQVVFGGVYGGYASAEATATSIWFE